MSLINKEEIKSFAPTNGYLLVVVKEEESKKNKIGVIVPPSGENDARKGIVLSVSKNEYKDKDTNVVSIEVGDEVLFKKWSGIELNHSDHEKVFAVAFLDLFSVKKAGGKS